MRKWSTMIPLSKKLLIHVLNVSEYATEIETFNEKIEKYTECTHSSPSFSWLRSVDFTLHQQRGQVVFIVKT